MTARHDQQALREALAALAHDQLSAWMTRMFDDCGVVLRLAVVAETCVPASADTMPIKMPESLELLHLRMTEYTRWRIRATTPYAELTEEEKAEARQWADRAIAAFVLDDPEPVLPQQGRTRVASHGVIGAWLTTGRQRGTRYMLVVCNGFDHTDYPVYCDAEKCREWVAKPGDMQRIRECYDLELPLHDQISEVWAWHPPTTPPGHPVGGPAA